MRTKRVLLAWEQGAGFGHTIQLARLGQRLMAAGAEVVAAVRYLQNAGPLTEAGIRTLQAPSWPAPAPRPGDVVPASATLTDSLARVGLRDSASVRAVLRAWRELFDAERPDLVVCDYAPLAGLAARGRARVMQASTAYCLPPADLEAMPLFHHFHPPAHTDAEVLASVNDAVDAEGLASIDRIGGLFGGDDAFVRSFPLIDPYADLRAGEAEGPVMEGVMREREDGARSIFAYLHADVAARPDVAAVLMALADRLEIHVPGVEADWLSALTGAGARVHRRAVPMADALARSRLLLHQGSAGVAADALAAGVPQFTLSVHVEHYLNGEALAAAGLSRNVPLFDPKARADVDAVRAWLEDDDALLIAAAAGRMHRAMLDEANPLDMLTGRCLDLL
ncbi:nucleotide disphospho-sugar-binding domain-containing protein [Xanthobacter sp. KR7-65]|uniref:nucleotide disphospho-sugar-binding domain-containing protein n=1 Tax=Xanthobacter sp. KR7-65 TaxID=3156612 RepID=UPI0032B480B6